LRSLRSDDEQAATSAANATLVVDTTLIERDRERSVMRFDMEEFSAHP
jgi:hypothetical protein